MDASLMVDGFYFFLRKKTYYNMLKRVVKLTLKTEKIAEFVEKFPSRKEKILTMPGCHGVDLFQDKTDPRIFFTISKWDDEAALNNYRHSDYFRATWAYMKQGFDDKPQAWSLDEL